MRLTVLYFAAVRELRGVDREEIVRDGPLTIADLYRDLLGPEGPTVAYTRNRAVVSGATEVADGDEISFLPPLGGG